MLLFEEVSGTSLRSSSLGLSYTCRLFNLAQRLERTPSKRSEPMADQLATLCLLPGIACCRLTAFSQSGRFFQHCGAVIIAAQEHMIALMHPGFVAALDQKFHAHGTTEEDSSSGLFGSKPLRAGTPTQVRCHPLHRVCMAGSS
jgi:hypothetical protein